MSKGKDERFESALVAVGAVESEDAIAELIGKHLKIGALRLGDVELNPDVVKLIPLDIARKFKVSKRSVFISNGSEALIKILYQHSSQHYPKCPKPPQTELMFLLYLGK